MEVAVKNDEHLVKLAAVIQRMVSNKNEDGNSFLTDEEKDNLLREIKSISESQEEIKVDESTKDNISRTGL